MDRRDGADAEGLRGIERAGGDEHGGETDEGVNEATSCGIAVIWTVRARQVPKLPPMAIPTSTKSQLERSGGNR